MSVSPSGTCTDWFSTGTAPPKMRTWNSSEGMRAKLAIAAASVCMLPSRNTITLAAIRLTVTHWNAIDRRGFSSESGMKATVLYPPIAGLPGGRLRRPALAVLAGPPQNVLSAEVVDVAAGHEQQVRQAVDVLQRRRAHGLVGIVGKPDDVALGAPADGARHMQRRRRRRA